MGEPYNARRRIDINWPDGKNCYSFAANCRNPTGTGTISAMPGAKAGFRLVRRFDRRALVDACIADGFDYSGWGGSAQPACPNTHYLVAVFIDGLNIFHFARQREDRQWVHKPGPSQPAHNVTAKGDYLLGTDLSNVPWGHIQLITYLRAPWTGVVVSNGNWA